MQEMQHTVEGLDIHHTLAFVESKIHKRDLMCITAKSLHLKLRTEGQSLVRNQVFNCYIYRVEMNVYVFPDCVWGCAVMEPMTVER